MLKWRWLNTFSQGNKTGSRGELWVRGSQNRHVCVIYLIVPPTCSSGLAMMVLSTLWRVFTKEPGSFILSDNFLFLVITPSELQFAALLVIRVLGKALLSHEPCAGSSWEVMEGQQLTTTAFHGEEVAHDSMFYGLTSASQKVCWSSSPQYFRMWPYLDAGSCQA